MDFNQYKCPVCNKQFESGDDIVVCPECGAPHHRECYEEHGSCFFEDKHSQDFSFENFNAVNSDNSDENDNTCPVCRFNNKPGVMFCERCGCPLHDKQQNHNTDDNNQNQQFNQNTQNTQSSYTYQNGQFNRNNTQTPPPFGFGAAGVPNFDPLAGMNSEETIADDISVGEMAKFVGKNTNYFLMVFNRVKQFGRSKFNFGAFLFSGVYFLYRKMYLPGIIFSLLIIATNVLATYLRLTPEYISASNEVISYINNRSAMSSYDALMMTNKIWIIYAPELLTWVRYGIMLFSGFLANRIYLGHCVKGIKKVKAQNQGKNINDKLTAKGGVNLPLALSFGIAIVVILFICEYFQLTVI